MKTQSRPRILVACVGNVFLGDDGFGVEVAGRLAQRKLPAEVRVIDFGIRGLDLAYAMLDGYEAVILVDAAPRGEAPGTLYVMEPKEHRLADFSGERPLADAHNLDPAKVLRLVAAMGGATERLLLVGCEPKPMDDADEMRMGLSPPVQRAVIEAIPLIESLIDDLLSKNKKRAAARAKPRAAEHHIVSEENHA